MLNANNIYSFKLYVQILLLSDQTCILVYYFYFIINIYIFKKMFNIVSASS